jgi:RHS repeat-associated protein
LEFSDAPANLEIYFGAKRVATTQNGATTSYWQDRLGSNRAGTYYPWGEDRGTPAPNDQVKFATYTRDSATLLDYADQRYYGNAQGRFMTPDPSTGGSGSSPETWNKYAYAGGDPVNFNDPRGTNPIPVFAPPPVSGCDEFETECGNDGGYCDPSQGPCDNTCVGADGFTQNPNPNCQIGGVATGDSGGSQPMPQCDVKEQFAPVPGTFHAGVHTYLDVEIAGAWSVLEATSSTLNPLSSNAQLEASITPGQLGGLNIDNPAKDKTVWDAQIDTTLTAQQLCDDAQSIMNAATAFRQNHAPGSPGAVPYNLFGSHGIPNSNSFVRYLLTFAPDFGTVPHSKRARGWKNLVLGQ